MPTALSRTQCAHDELPNWSAFYRRLQEVAVYCISGIPDEMSDDVELAIRETEYLWSETLQDSVLANWRQPNVAVSTALTVALQNLKDSMSGECLIVRSHSNEDVEAAKTSRQEFFDGLKVDAPEQILRALARSLTERP